MFSTVAGMDRCPLHTLKLSGVNLSWGGSIVLAGAVVAIAEVEVSGAGLNQWQLDKMF